MKTMKTLLKLTAAVAAMAGIAYLVVKHIDTITEWLKNLCPACKCSAEPVVEDTPVQEAAAEDVPAEEESSIEETPAQETDEEGAPIPEGEPVAEESDFES